MIRDKAFNIAKDAKNGRCQGDIKRYLASLIYKYFDEKFPDGVATRARWETIATRDKSATENKKMWNQQLVEELNKSIIRKLKKRKVYSSFEDYLGYWSSRDATNK